MSLHGTSGSVTSAPRGPGVLSGARLWAPADAIEDMAAHVRGKLHVIYYVLGVGAAPRTGYWVRGPGHDLIFHHR